MTPQFYTAYDIRDMLNISYQNTLIFIRNSGIPYLKVGRTYRVEKEAFHDFIKKTSITSTIE